MTWNSTIPYNSPSLQELADTVGITQFQGTDSWFQVLGGLILQGGKVDIPDPADVSITFPAPYSKQVLGIFIEEIDGVGSVYTVVQTFNLTGFTIRHNHSGYSAFWFAIGV